MLKNGKTAHQLLKRLSIDGAKIAQENRLAKVENGVLNAWGNRLAFAVRSCGVRRCSGCAIR